MKATCGFGISVPGFWIGLVLFFGLSGSMQAQNGVPGDGTEILRGLVKYHGYTPVATLNRDMRSTLVVIVGHEQIPAQFQPLLRQLLLDGGALLVISDGPFNLRNFLPRVGNLNTNIRITGLRVSQFPAANGFRGEAQSPLATLVPGEPTLMALVKRGGPALLATRSPSTISSLRNPYLNVEMLHYADGAIYDGGDAIAVRADTPLAAMSDPALPGLAMAFANRALFSNAMMVASDLNGNRSDNFLYSFLTVRYLTERIKANGGPRECLFIEDGRTETDFDRVGFMERPAGNLPPGAVPPLPPLPVLLDFALDKGNDLVAQAEARDIPNVAQQNDPNNQIQNGILTTLAVVMTIVLARYLLARGWTTRHAPELAPRVRIDPDRGGVIPERRYALLESGNLYEPMRDHLRHVFTQWNAPPDIATGLPPLETDRPSRPIRRISGDLIRLWIIAYAPERTPVAPDDLEELEDMISELTKAHEFGVWRFAAGGSA